MSGIYKELAMNPYFYRVLEVVKVVDGDTVDVVIDLGFKLTMKLRIRMTGYDAPETYRPKCDAERKAGLKVKEYLKSLLEKYKDCLHIATQPVPGIYGRWQGTLYALKGNSVVCINAEVLEFMKENKLTKEEIRKDC